MWNEKGGKGRTIKQRGRATFESLERKVFMWCGRYLTCPIALKEFRLIASVFFQQPLSSPSTKNGGLGVRGLGAGLRRKSGMFTV